MPQDQPATVAGTDSKTCNAHPADGPWCSNLGQSHQCGRPAGHRTPHRCEVCGTEWNNEAGTPDTWAPVNRRAMRDDVDRFRNLRMPVPATRADAIELVELALEYYEHAHEVATRTANTVAELEAETLACFPVGGQFDESNSAHEHYRRTLAKKGEADKELAVADRRHATALAYLNTFKGE